jgi:hypothetical protein
VYERAKRASHIHVVTTTDERDVMAHQVIGTGAGAFFISGILLHYSL